MWDLSSPTRDQTHVPLHWRGSSFKHWTTREVPTPHFFRVWLGSLMWHLQISLCDHYGINLSHLSNQGVNATSVETVRVHACTLYWTYTMTARLAHCRVVSSYCALLWLPGEGNGTHSSTLAWKTPWAEEPGGLHSMGLQRAGHNWATTLSLSATIDLWRNTSFPFMMFIT